MHITRLISPESVSCCQETTSKKRALEQLSQLLSQRTPSITAEEIFDCLVGRERLGSTGLGHGVGIPHGRMAGLETPLAACLTLDAGVDFDAIDRKPVDLLVALLVPEEATDEHLQLLAQLASMFSDNDFTQKLREARTSQELYRLLQDWEAKHANA
ncbi:MAG: PTS IIA-like nitrogen regulatory protein PtsN [Gammaproteobacteria bacterium]|nr:PTS IIA-like nitrogen regulatory protein PtsN [Gammaproteobacteria bacterium]MBU2477676.1 PTS IIA-like nitrogen regulatory protein PtsN [Gammaproteobacteria bacterium]